MAITYCIKPEHDLFILAHKGTTTDNELLAIYKLLLQDHALDSTMNLLVDLRSADSVPRSPDALRVLADFVREYYQGASRHPKVAVVAPTDISFGLARMYGAFADAIPWDFKVFRAIDAALTWLGLPENLAVDHSCDAQPAH